MVHYRGKKNLRITKQVPRLDRWAYLAGLIEADGHIKYSQGYKRVTAITIAGHKNQTTHFYWLAHAVGMPFTLTMATNGNVLKLVWTNPRALAYIIGRLRAFILYQNSFLNTDKLFIKLGFLTNLSTSFNLSNSKSTRLLRSYKVYLSRVCVYPEPKKLLIASILVGFIDGDGEAAIQIGATHRGSQSKNIVSGRLRISQKNREPLDAIVYLFSKLNPDSSQQDSDIFNPIKVHSRKSGGYDLYLTEKQSVYFSRFVAYSFRNPWTCLGAYLIRIINEFKDCYDFAALGRHVRKKTAESNSLVYWAKQRMYLMVVLQLIRLFIRSPQSLGIARQKKRLFEAAEFLEENSLQSGSKNCRMFLDTRQELLEGLENGCLDVQLLYPLLREVLIVNALTYGRSFCNSKSYGKIRLLQTRTLSNIIRGAALHTTISMLNARVAFQISNDLGKEKLKTISVTYYPSLYLAEESQRFKPNTRLIEVNSIFIKTWYKTRDFLL